ncbi:MAG: tetratricopeptide repeat protein [Methylococcales bacterium]
MASQIKPKEQKALQQAQSFLSQNDAESAKNLLVTYTRKNKASHNTRYLLSLSHAILGEFKEALIPANLLVKEQAKNIEYLKLLGGIFHGLLQYEQAIAIFNRALKINPQDIQTLSNIASSLKESQHYDEAETYFKQSLTLHANQPDALTNYGLLLQDNAKLDEAIELHNKALQLAPEHNVAMYNLAYALNEKGKHESSLQAYQRVLKITPYHVRALCDIAHVYGKLMQAENAMPYLQRALEVSPEDEHVHLNVGISHKMLGQFKQAENSFEKVIQINQHNNTAKYYLAIMRGDSTMVSSPDEYVQELFNGYAETFDDQLIGQLHYKTPELIGSMVTKHSDLNKKHKILDLGCGTGLAGIYLKDISEHMIGIDLSSKMLKKAEDRNIYNELVTSAIDQYFENHDFQPDIVVSADVFVYIGDIASIFENTSKSISDDGIFVFSTEDTQDADQFILKDSGRFAHNEKYIRSLANSYNFEFIDHEKTIIRYEADTPIHGQVYLLKKVIK